MTKTTLEALFSGFINDQACEGTTVVEIMTSTATVRNHSSLINDQDLWGTEVV